MVLEQEKRHEGWQVRASYIQRFGYQAQRRHRENEEDEVDYGDIECTEDLDTGGTLRSEDNTRNPLVDQVLLSDIRARRNHLKYNTVCVLAYC